MTIFQSLTGRLMFSLTAVLVVVWLAAVGIATFVIGEELGESLDSAMQETAQRLLPLVVDDLFLRDGNLPPLVLATPTVAPHEEYLRYQVRDGDGRVLMHSHDAGPEPLTQTLAAGFADTPDDRIYTEASISNTLFIQVAEPHSYRREAIRDSFAAFLLPLLALLPAGALAVFFVVSYSTRPIAALRADMAMRDGGNLQPLPEHPLPTELRAIAHSVDGLLARLRMALESEREFTANAAHELRTPIAGALAQAQRLAAEQTDPAAKHRAEQMAVALRTLAERTEKLLQLARADAGIAAGSQTRDLLPLLALLVEELRPHEGPGARLDYTPAKGAALIGSIEPDAFAIVVRNLIENAVRHGSPDGAIEIGIVDEKTLRVVNGCAPLPPDLMQRLGTRFQRGPAKAPGSGLGLAIVRKMLEQAGGSLELRSPATGRSDGFEAIARFA